MVLVEDNIIAYPKELTRNSLPRKLFPVVALLIPLIVYVLSLRYYDNIYGFNVLAAQYALWTNHSFSVGVPNDTISRLIPNIDTIAHNGVYFTAYAPGLALIAFPFSAIGFMLDGGKLLSNGNAILMLESFVALTGALASFLTYKICLLFSRRPFPSLLAALTLAFSTTAWPFASVGFPHDATMFFILGATYAVVHYFSVSPKPVYLLLGGISIGIASTLDYVATILVIPIAIYILLQIRISKSLPSFSRLATGFRAAATGRAGLLTLLIGFAATGPLVILAYNQFVFGNPFDFSEEFFREVPAGQRNIGGLEGRFQFGALPFHMLFNLLSLYRGLFVLSPILILGLYGLYKMFRSNNFRLEAALFSALFLCVFVPYSAWDAWYAGGSYGPRFLVPALPFLVIPTFMIWNRANLNKAKRIFTGGLYFILFAIGAITQGMGAITNATPYNVTPPQPLVYQLTEYAFPYLFKAQLGVWFLHRLYNAGNLRIDLTFVVMLFGSILGISGYLIYKCVNHFDENKLQAGVAVRNEQYERPAKEEKVVFARSSQTPDPEKSGNPRVS
ncbi:MAG: hypothetical protein ACREBS_04845 [Nitrososphaerales archaeon]